MAADKNYLDIIDSTKKKESTVDKYFRKVDSKWDESIANSLSPVERLVYRSNLLGVDSYINNTGGAIPQAN